MPLKTRKAGGILPIFLFLIILFSLPVMASFTSEWGEYQDDSSNRGFVHDAEGYFSEGNDTTTICSMTKGMNYQTLAGDWDNDLKNEFVIFRASSLQVYNSDCNIDYEISIATNLATQPTMINDELITFVGLNDIAYVYNLSNTSIPQIFNFTTLTSCADRSGITCKNSQCYMICDINGLNSTVFAWNTTGNRSSIITAVDDIGSKGSPAINPLVSSSYDSIMFVCDADGDGVFGICALRADTLSLDIDFSTDGIIDNLDSSYPGEPNPPIIYDVDGGNNEVLLSFTHCAGNDNTAYLNVYENDGTQLWSKTTAIRTSTCTVTDYDISPPVVALKNDINNYCIFIPGDSAGSFRGFKCYDGDGDITYENNSITGLANSEATRGCTNCIVNLAAAKLLDSTNNNDDDLVWYKDIISLETNKPEHDIITSSTSLQANYSLSLIDMDDDTSLDIILTRSDQTYIFGSSTFTNTPPSLYNNLSFGGYGDNIGISDGTKVCLDTNVTFSAQENLNYDNDVSTENERLVTNCGQNADGTAVSSFTSNRNNGTYSLGAPTINCNYNVTGLFQVRIYLQDEANDDDYSEYNTETIIVHVIDGVEGITCNDGIAVSPGDTEDISAISEAEERNEAISTFLDPLAGTGDSSDKLKMIIALMMIAMILAGLVKEGVHDPWVLTIVGTIVTLIFTFLGMIPAVIVFVIILLMVLVSIFFIWIVPRGGGGA